MRKIVFSGSFEKFMKRGRIGKGEFREGRELFIKNRKTLEVQKVVCMFP